MGNYRKTGQRIIKSTILHDVYCENLASEQLPRIQQPLSLRRYPEWVRMGSLVLVLSLAVIATYVVLQHSDGVIPGVEIVDAKYSAAGWNQNMLPLIPDANAGVVPPGGRFPDNDLSFDETALLSGEGAVSPLGQGAATDSGILGAGNYQMLLGWPDVAIADLFGLGVHTIVIDAGHGGKDPGAIGSGGLMEKDITLKIARLLYNRLADEEGINVVMTRDSDVTLSLKHRVEYARQHDADLLISIHLNTIPDSPMTIVETYYFGPPADDQSMAVAKKENYHSGYAVAEFNELIAGLGDTLKQQESRKLASHIQKNIYGTLSRDNRSIINVGIKTAPFVLLLGAETPSVLAEVNCISNTEEEARLAKPAYRDKIAGALERGILSYLNQFRQQDRQRPEQGSIIHAES